MGWNFALLLVLSSLLAAVGQVMLKYSATGRGAILEYVNAWSFAGFGCYAVGAVLWVYCLARVPLLKVYPFTSLTFMLTILAGIVVFNETATTTYWVGIGLIFTGLLLVSL